MCWHVSMSTFDLSSLSYHMRFVVTLTFDLEVAFCTRNLNYLQLAGQTGIIDIDVWMWQTDKCIVEPFVVSCELSCRRRRWYTTVLSVSQSMVTLCMTVECFAHTHTHTHTQGECVNDKFMLMSHISLIVSACVHCRLRLASFSLASFIS